jgi:proline iminopeptidase
LLIQRFEKDQPKIAHRADIRNWNLMFPFFQLRRNNNLKALDNVNTAGYLKGLLLFFLLASCSQTVVHPIQERTEGFVTVGDGVRIYYVEKGSGPEVLVAPAALYLEPLLLDDLSANRRVVFYDPRNRGRSDSADLSSVSLDRQIEDLEELRGELGLEKMMLLGWSSYGLEMAVYAMRYPERVTHLVQISPLAPASALLEQFSDTHDQRTDRLAIEALDRRSDAGDFDDSPEEYCRLRNALTIPPDFVNTDLAKQAPDDCKYPNEWPKNRSPYFRAFFATFGDFDWRNDLNGLKIPRLIIHGREDRVPLEGGKAWAEGYTDARLIVVSPSGHFPFIEQKEVVLAAIETFLDGDWPQDAIVVQSDDDLQ